jgi:uncharacterized protein (DUF2147 family)
VKYLLLSALFFLFFKNTTVAQNNPDGCLGVWLTGSKKGHIEIFRKDNQYFGKIVWLKDPLDAKTGKPPIDSKNPDASKRNQPIVGLVNLRNLKYQSNGQWDNGRIYDPENGKEYDCKMKLVNANQLDVRGYIGVSIMGRTENWKRVK